jgi:hypothetical protein
MATEASAVEPVLTIRSRTSMLSTDAIDRELDRPNETKRRIGTITEISSISRPQLVIASTGRAPDSPALPEPSQVKSVDAVVLDVSDVSVALSCHTPDNSIRISLPRDLVPTDLAKYGTPVTLSLNSSGSIRYPVVSAREYKRPDAKSEEEVQIDQWIDTL